MTNYFKAEKVSDKVTAIRSRSGEIMYLIEGDNKSVLIDTCLGVKGLREIVDGLTNKPVTVLLTHGHIDHAMGAAEFDEVYMNPLDREVYLEHRGLEGRKGYIAGNIGGEEPWILDDTNFVQTKEPEEFLELRDQSIFELGGISVKVYALPGHTKGTMIMLIPEERILITGDACNNSVFLFDHHSTTIEQYRQNLFYMQQRLEGKFDRCFMMHHVMEASKHLMKNVILVCDDIMSGNTDDMEFSFMGHTSYLAKKVNEQFVRADGGEGNIIYNKQKVFYEG